ncbi:hypothetical protein QAD02_000276, partial [Eretmocerus hayati]
YVYNPKEARLRKAMREQGRCNTTTPTTNNNNNNNNNSTQASAAVGAHLLSSVGTRTHQNLSSDTSSPHHEIQQQQQQQQPALSPSLPGQNRIIGPWFPLGGAALPPTHHQQHQHQQPTPAKQTLSPRSQNQHQNRSLDKTKEAIRRQLESCGMQAAHAAGMQPFTTHESAAAAAAATTGTDFCGPVGGFADAHKWHPYQNGMSAYHSRSSLMSKMSNLHRGMQSAACHAAASAWGQFCNVPFRNQHHGYQDLQQFQTYEAKLHDDLARRLSSSYPQTEHQVKSPTPSRTASSREDSASEDGPRWCNEPRPSSVCSSSCTTDGEQPPMQSQPQQPPRSMKPLPGFQQAFGSTEIGRFSRSELFASLIEAANNVSSSSDEQRSPSPSPPPSQTQACWHSPYAVGSET